MKVAMRIPEGTPPTGGNRRSAERLAAELRRRGLVVTIAEGAEPDPAADVYHAWNAVRVGAVLLARGVDPGRIVMTWTGTDLWQDFVERPEVIRRQLAAAPYLVTFTDDARAALVARAPEWADRIRVIPPGVDTARFQPGPGRLPYPRPVFVVAGGIRPVKRMDRAIAWVEALRVATGRSVALAIVGPVRDAAEGDRIRRLAGDRPWVHLVGEIPLDEMPRWYQGADVVLNTSDVEGVSNSVMEAMASGAVVVATDIPGNRALIQDGTTGFLCSDGDRFVATIEALWTGRIDARAVGAAARAAMVAQHGLDVEAARYAALYEAALADRTRVGCDQR
jgi:glycosyltransferase involved in cell wall biosynthesis